MSAASKAVVVVEKWIKIPDIKTECIQGVAKAAVAEFNKKYGNSLKFESLYDGWYWEISPTIIPTTIKYKLLIRALDFLNRVLNYQIIIREEKINKQRIREVEEFIVIATPGHDVGDIPPVTKIKWVKIPNLNELFIIEVAKFSLDKFNKLFGENLTYDSISDGWYREVGQDNIEFHLYVKAKDKDGHVGIYHVIVLVEHFLTKRTKTLLSFKIILVKETSVQVIIKFVIEELKKIYDVVLIFDSFIKEGSYIELGPHGVIRYHIVIKAKDILGRLLHFQIIVEKHGNTLKFISITVIASPGHCVGPTKPPSEKKWIKIPCLTIPLIQELIVIATKEIGNRIGDLLHYVSISEGWYCELGGEEIEIRIIIILKDCLGRVQKFEVIINIKLFFSKKVKTFVSYKCITE